MKYSCVSLGGLVTISGGGTPSRNNDAYWGGSIPWATVKDLKGTTLSSTQETITPEGLRDSASNLIPAGSVIVATRMGLGKVAINTIDVTINQDLKAFSCSAGLDPRYLMYYLLVNASHLDSMGKGATVKGITLDVLKDLFIPLPPLPEQKRIAAILDKADSIRRKRQEAVRLTEELLRSAFLDMFGDPVRNPKGWETKKFEDLLEITLRNGLSPSTGGQYPGNVLTLSAITGSFFDASAIKSAVFSQDLPPDKFVNPRDFLICRGNGNPHLVGKGKFPINEIENTLFPDTMISARIAPGKVVPEFLEMIWHTQLVRSQIDKGARTTNGTYKVNQGVLNSVKILCPPIEIQTRFSVIVKSAVRAQIKNNESLEISNTLFNSLLQRAFKGEL